MRKRRKEEDESDEEDNAGEKDEEGSKGENEKSKSDFLSRLFKNPFKKSPRAQRLEECSKEAKAEYNSATKKCEQEYKNTPRGGRKKKKSRKKKRKRRNKSKK